MAESSTGSRSHVVGVIRLIVFIMLIAVAVFFLVLFIRNRQSDKTALELTQVSQNDKNKDTQAAEKEEKKEATTSDDAKESGTSDSQADTSDKKSTESKKEEDTKKTKEDSSQTITIPGGIEDAPSDGVKNIGNDSLQTKNAPAASSDTALPEAGTGTDMIIVAGLLSVSTYVLMQRKMILSAVKR